MKYSIKPVPSFLKELKRLSKRYVSIKEDVLALGRSLQMNPNQGVDLGRGLRKIRMVITSSKGRGKSGGVRVITLNVVFDADSVEILLVGIYDKTERENITMKEIETLLEKNGLAG